MKTTAKTQETVTPEKIIDEIIIWDDPLNFQMDLRKMLDAFLLYHDDFADGEKESVYFTFRLLSDALEDMEQLNPRKKNYVSLTDQEKAELDARRAREKAMELQEGNYDSQRKWLKMMYEFAEQGTMVEEWRNGLKNTWLALDASLVADIKSTETLGVPTEGRISRQDMIKIVGEKALEKSFIQGDLFTISDDPGDPDSDYYVLKKDWEAFMKKRKAMVS